jgi:hypothetical protein
MIKYKRQNDLDNAIFFQEYISLDKFGWFEKINKDGFPKLIIIMGQNLF